jgi:release factor glutamine methyltransferase
MTAREALRRGTERLRAVGVEIPGLESRLLLAHAVGTSLESLLGDPCREVDPQRFDEFVARRAAREPMALILGRREFWSLDFAVSGATLIPRPDSETLIEAALALFPERAAVGRILDLGTGTGCLLLAALSEFPAAFGVGVDRAEPVVRLARRNAVALGLAQRAGFAVADWGGALRGRFDLVLCNPPYIASSDLPALMADVRDYEPRSALEGGEDGLDAYRALLPALPVLLAPGGAGVFELGRDQARAVKALANEAGLTTSLVADLGGIARALILRVAMP